MIRYLKRQDLDVNKYDNCIKLAINSRIYAYSWYLDIVADNWCVLVLNDYEAVMPLPFLRARRFLYIKKIIQPTFCQQLGVFYKENISEIALNKFYSEFIKLNPKAYNFNILNSLSASKEINERVNYELNLFRQYDEIWSDYSKNLKRNINKSKQYRLVVAKNIPIDILVQMKKETKKHKVKKAQFKTLKLLMQKLISKNNGTTYGVYYKKELVASAFFINEENRITHLISSTTKLGKDVCAIPFLFDCIIKENIKTNLIFDFEGSMIKGVARFFNSFGALPFKYNSFKNNG